MTVAYRSNAGMTIHGGERWEAREYSARPEWNKDRSRERREKRMAQAERERKENSVAHANIGARHK